MMPATVVTGKWGCSLGWRTWLTSFNDARHRRDGKAGIGARLMPGPLPASMMPATVVTGKEQHVGAVAQPGQASMMPATVVTGKRWPPRASPRPIRFNDARHRRDGKVDRLAGAVVGPVVL